MFVMCGAEQAKMHGQFARWGATNLVIRHAVSSRFHLKVRPPRGGLPGQSGFPLSGDCKVASIAPTDPARQRLGRSDWQCWSEGLRRIFQAVWQRQCIVTRGPAPVAPDTTSRH